MIIFIRVILCKYICIILILNCIDFHVSSISSTELCLARLTGLKALSETLQMIVPTTSAEIKTELLCSIHSDRLRLTSCLLHRNNLFTLVFSAVVGLKGRETETQR